MTALGVAFPTFLAREKLYLFYYVINVVILLDKLFDSIKFKVGFLKNGSPFQRSSSNCWPALLAGFVRPKDGTYRQ
jgi:hypothetical protein